MDADAEDSGEFSYRERGDGSVAVSWRGRVVVTLAGRQAARFLAGVRDADAASAQLWMARVTGNFKRGNERRPGRR
jgi:hypothetical protein